MYTRFINEDPIFKHNIRIFNMLDFHYARQWMTKTYGEGVNIRCLPNGEFSQLKWGWQLRTHEYIICLRDDSILNWFTLKYGEQAG
jgi:hypothetical protein